MRRFVSWLVTWWRPAAVEAPLPAAPLVPPWTRIDSENWLRILQSETGRRMLARARAVHYQSLKAASEDHFHAAQAVHAARGFEEAIIWLESLAISRAAGAQAATASGKHGDASTTETPEQAIEREMREMIERSSP